MNSLVKFRLLRRLSVGLAVEVYMCLTPETTGCINICYKLVPFFNTKLSQSVTRSYACVRCDLT